MSGTKGSTLYQRLRAVEMAIVKTGWGPSVVKALAAQFGCSERQVFKYRASVLVAIRESQSYASTDEERAEFIFRVRHHQADAAKNLSFGPLSSLLNIEAEVRGLKSTTIHLDGAPTTVVLGAAVAAPADADDE